MKKRTFLASILALVAAPFVRREKVKTTLVLRATGYGKTWTYEHYEISSEKWEQIERQTKLAIEMTYQPMPSFDVIRDA